MMVMAERKSSVYLIVVIPCTDSYAHECLSGFFFVPNRTVEYRKFFNQELISVLKE